MQSFAEALKAYTRSHPFDPGNDDSETVLDQLYQAYGRRSVTVLKNWKTFFAQLLDDNNAVFNP